MPRYDVPKAAPEPLRLVQRFVNTVDHEHGREWIGTTAELADFLGCEETEVDVERAHEIREALRMLLRANNGAPLDTYALGAVNRAAAELRLELDEGGRVVVAAGDPLGRLVAVAFGAMLEGTWPRLKACRNCKWAFYDYSKNRAASWCSMQLCGNRLKTRAYRSRRARP
ncbi:MAG TPA: CGNR zinc finger domain-containing protein [Gaiellaceae bacterium]|nr:CGNR zinc finger domain-containing protein [Gaiellaceae bacterium]